jgi:integrase
MYCDGGGLYLQVTEGSDGAMRKSWLFRFATGETAVSRSGKPRRVEREMGLGPYPSKSLADARKAADEARKLRELAIDPIEARKARRAASAVASAKAMSFDQCRDAYIEAHRAGWRNAKHGAQWTATLETYASPVFGALPVQAVDIGLVTKVLEPIWSKKPETASRVRGRIESILDWARVRGLREGENPARWRGCLEKLLPARAKVRKVEHHAAVPYPELPAFMASLRSQEGVAARALEFTIVTAARSGETLGARWSEIDLGAKVWIVPADRMKADREHRVPLSIGALTVLKAMQKVREGEFVFAGSRRAMLSNMAMAMLLRRMNRNETVHGFRSSFRDWVSERTNFPREVAEAALAHAIESKVEAAYRRGDLFEKRRKLMDAWGTFCTSAPAAGRVVSLIQPGA